jgi:murein DD-endopeptidase MepM/ murein hydrolase activator NlpD
MAAFTMDMSSPLPAGFTKHHGGPGHGGHDKAAKWYIAFGMDLGAPAGTNVFAAFDGKVTVFNPDRATPPGSKQFGAEIFVRSSNDMMGGFYTHIDDVPATVKKGATISRGDRLGRIKAFNPDHLHFALVEIIGGAPGGRYAGVSLLPTFVAISNTPGVIQVTFNQNGTPPTVAGP